MESKFSELDHDSESEQPEHKEEPNPFEEAFFIKFDGSPIKKNIPKNNDNDNVPPLVQLDLRFDLLRVFLENISKTVNQHNELLNIVQSDIKKRATESCLTEYFERISEGLHKDCGERPHTLRLNDEANQFYQCEDSPFLRRSVDKLTGKLELISVHLLNAASSEFNSEKIRIQNELYDFTKEKLAEFQEKLLEHEQTLEEKKIYCENLVKQNETNTLWKIKDCEELLQTRVSQKYVSDAIDVLEMKFRRDVESIKHRDNENQERLFREANARIDLLAKNNNEEINSIRGNLGYIDSLVKKKANPEDVKQISNSLKDMKYGYEREIEEVTNHIHSIEDKFADFKRKFTNVETFVNNLKDRSITDIDPKKGEGNGGEYNAESSIKLKLFDEKKWINKAEKIELIRIENAYVTKEEIVALLPSEESKNTLKEEFKSEIAYFHKSIDELARAWDLKLVKLRKEIDLYSIKRDINTRAKEEDVKIEIGTIDDKCARVEQIVTKVSFEFEQVREFIKRVGKNIKELQDMNQNIMLGKQNINCLSCGRGENNKKHNTSIPLIKGKDGRIYKGGISKGYVGMLDKSLGDADVMNNKFFSVRRENSPPQKINQSQTNSRKQFNKPSSAFQRRRCTTALSRQNDSQTSIKKNMNNSEAQIIQDSDIYKGASIYPQNDYDKM